MDDYRNEYEVLKRGFKGSGISAEFRREPDDRWSVAVTIHDTRLSPYFGDLRDGGWVVDLNPCTWDDVWSVAVSGPMLGLHLPHQEVDRCPTPDAAFVAALSMDPTNEFGQLARKKAADPKWSGLDRVDLTTWLDLRRRIGARIGRRHGPTIAWEDGTTTMIPPAAERYRGMPVDDVAGPDDAGVDHG